MHNRTIISSQLTAHSSQLTAHAIMFHHFHNNKNHITGQGSISSDDLNNLLDYYGKFYNIISAEEFLFRSQNNSLSPSDVSLSFDDGLLCQYDIALPVLEQRSIKAFWFIYTSPVKGILEKLEIYRHFRFSKFQNIEEFYAAFFDFAFSVNSEAEEKIKNFDPNKYAQGFPFYTPNDKRFRYLRDKVLTEAQYNSIMEGMIHKYKYNVQENSKLLWLKNEHIKNLSDNGHIIGLHSHTHPTTMNTRTFDEQMQEYRKNEECLEEITGRKIISVSYPCNSYNENTIKCMRELGITIGFRANMLNERICDQKLEYPREDHSNIIGRMKNEHNSIHE